MKLKLLFFKAPLYIAVEKENTEIVKLLLKNYKLNVNVINILNLKLNEIVILCL